MDFSNIKDFNNIPLGEINELLKKQAKEIQILKNRIWQINSDLLEELFPQYADVQIPNELLYELVIKKRRDSGIFNFRFSGTNISFTKDKFEEKYLKPLLKI